MLIVLRLIVTMMWGRHSCRQAGFLAGLCLRTVKTIRHDCRLAAMTGGPTELIILRSLMLRALGAAHRFQPG